MRRRDSERRRTRNSLGDDGFAGRRVRRDEHRFFALKTTDRLALKVVERERVLAHQLRRQRRVVDGVARSRRKRLGQTDFVAARVQSGAELPLVRRRTVAQKRATSHVVAVDCGRRCRCRCRCRRRSGTARRARIHFFGSSLRHCNKDDHEEKQQYTIYINT